MRLKFPMLKFCEQVAMGSNVIRAYMASYPNANAGTANTHGRELLRRADIQAEIWRLRAQAEQMAGPAFLSLIEKRVFLARLVRAQFALLPHDSDLWQSMHQSSRGTFFRLPDKVEAIIADNELSADDSTEQDSLMQLLISVRK